MPVRKQLLVTGEIYHVYNRGIDRRPTFTTKSEFSRAHEAIWFYSLSFTTPSLSKYLAYDREQRTRFQTQLNSFPQHVEIFAYCLMDNHFHILLRQTRDHGISKYIGDFQNSYTRYHNLRHDRQGPLFLPQFKAKRIETEEQLMHVSRYIHLNPYTAYLTKDIKQLATYPWSSLISYIDPAKSQPFVNTKPILSLFKNNQEYHNFVRNQADYQRQLHQITHLMLEE